MKRINIAIIVVILLAFLLAIYAYHAIAGNTVASHWNEKGEVNGYMSKFWGLFLMPIILVGLYVLFLLIPKIDPLKKNIQGFRRYYDLFILGLFIYLLYIFVLTILANLGYQFNITTMILPSVGLLFIGIGSFMKKLKRNWFIGIRTPWTISNDEVWKKTHALGAILFKIIGIIIIAGIFVQKYIIWIIIIPIVIMMVWLSVYSYVIYRKIEKKRD